METKSRDSSAYFVEKASKARKICVGVLKWPKNRPKAVFQGNRAKLRYFSYGKFIFI